MYDDRLQLDLNAQAISVMQAIQKAFVTYKSLETARARANGVTSPQIYGPSMEELESMVGKFKITVCGFFVVQIGDDLQHVGTIETKDQTPNIDTIQKSLEAMIVCGCQGSLNNVCRRR